MIRPMRSLTLGAATALVLLGVAAPSRAGLVINATYAANLTSDPNSATIISTIQSAINEYQASFSDNVTVSIAFQEGGGLGGSSQALYQFSYGTIRTALIADASTASDATAVATLPNQTNNPVSNQANLFISSANGRALGLNTPGATTFGGSNYDGVITLNTSIMNLDRTGAQNPSFYDLKSVVQHEIDEVLGLGSSVGSSLPNPRMQDLFRYSAAGTRSFATGAAAYLSIDGGVTNLVNFNTVTGGDSGDWASSSTTRVQDAFGTPGAQSSLFANGSVELINLDVIGYNRIASVAPGAVPEPATLGMLAFGGVASLAYARRRRVA